MSTVPKMPLNLITHSLTGIGILSINLGRFDDPVRFITGICIQIRWCFLNSLRPSDAIWRQGSMSTLVQVMACCLTAPSHYLPQCWLIISGSSGVLRSISYKLLTNQIDEVSLKVAVLKMIPISPKTQWVNWWIEVQVLASAGIITTKIPVHVLIRTSLQWYQMTIMTSQMTSKPGVYSTACSG